MGAVVRQEIKYCETCGHDTVHIKSGQKMNWVLHIILTVITAGLWLIVWFFIFIYHMIMDVGKDMASRWTCSKCGTKKTIL